MNVPPSVQSAQHGICVQVQSLPPPELFSKRAKTEWDYFVPPMTPVFATQTQTTTKSWKASRNASHTSYNGIPEGHGQFVRTGAATDDEEPNPQYENRFFIGVSTEGLPSGADVLRHGAKMGHFTVITRGIVTVMCDYHDVHNIPIGAHVKVKRCTHQFRGMGTENPFSLVGCTDSEDIEKYAIGVLLSKPSEDDKANEARLLLM